MYLPRHFHVEDLERQHALIRANSLAVLVCMLDDGLEANHVPVLLDNDAAGNGSLRFHLARANPVCAALDGKRSALMVFQAEQCYISPDWYRNPHGVPTWNYAAVHAHGVPQPLDDAALARLLEDLSADQERRLDKVPWTVDKLPADSYARMRRAITGFSMPIERLEGKWKMSQNRRKEDRQGVVAALRDLAGDVRLATADSVMALAPD